MNNFRVIHCLSLTLWSYTLVAYSSHNPPNFPIDTSEQLLVCKPDLYVVLPYIGNVDRDGDGVFDHIGADIPATDLLEIPILDSLDGTALQYSINLLGDTLNHEDGSLILTCKDYANHAGEFFVEVHAWSQSSRIGTCSSLILATPGHDGCEIDELCIVVSTRTVFGNDVPGVQVIMGGGPDTTLYTNANGSAMLYGQRWTELTLTPQLHSEPLQGVSVADIVRIRRHIVGVETLSNPYQLIAADVNNDEKVSTRDIVELQRMLIGRQETFLNNASWRFVCTDWDFEDPTNPWGQGPFPEHKLLETFTRSTFVDFIAIKVGDVTGEAPL